MPAGVRRTAGSALGRIPPSVVDRAARATSVLPVGWQVRNPSNKLAKLARVLSSSDPEDAYQALTTHWADSTSVVLGAGPQAVTGDGERITRSPALGSPSRCSGSTWSAILPDDILAKLDRAAMAVSLETRAPFLDRRVLDLAWSLPLDAKFRRGRDQMAIAPGAGTSRAVQRWSNGRKWASACLSEPGCGESSPPGPSTSSMSAGYVSKGCWTRSRFAGPGISTARGDGTWATSSGTFWSSSRGSIGGCRL